MATVVKAKPRGNEPEIGGEIGLSGLTQSGGVVREEFLRQLSGRQGVKVFREMADNDAIIGGVLFAIEMLIRNVEWLVEVNTEADRAEEAQQLIYECMDDMTHTWEDFVSEALSFLTFGWAVHEIVLKKRSGENDDFRLSSQYSDNKIGWARLPGRAQETLDRWEFNEYGDALAMYQRVQGIGDVAIPLARCLHFRTRTNKNNPEGRSIMRNAYRSWFFGKRIEEVEGIGVERDLAGLPVMYVDPRITGSSASADQKALFEEIKKTIVNIRRDEQEGVVIPNVLNDIGQPLYKLELLTSGGARQFNTSEIVNRYDQRKAMTMLADFIMLGHEAVGSFALSSDKTNMFATAIGGYMKSMKGTLNRYLIQRTLRLNGFNGDECYLDSRDLEIPNLAELGDFIQKLSGAGMPLFPDEGLESFIRNQVNWPDRPEEFDDEDYNNPRPATNEDAVLSPEETDDEEEETT